MQTNFLHYAIGGTAFLIIGNAANKIIGSTVITIINPMEQILQLALLFYRDIVGACFITDRPKSYCLNMLFNLLIKSIYI